MTLAERILNRLECELGSNHAEVLAFAQELKSAEAQPADRNAVLEEAAKVCQEHAPDYCLPGPRNQGALGAARDCAAAIRALKSEPVQAGAHVPTAICGYDRDTSIAEDGWRAGSVAVQAGMVDQEGELFGAWWAIQRDCKYCLCDREADDLELDRNQCRKCGRPFQ